MAASVTEARLRSDTGSAGWTAQERGGAVHRAHRRLWAAALHQAILCHHRSAGRGQTIQVRSRAETASRATNSVECYGAVTAAVGRCALVLPMRLDSSHRDRNTDDEDRSSARNVEPDSDGPLGGGSGFRGANTTSVRQIHFTALATVEKRGRAQKTSSAG